MPARRAIPWGDELGRKEFWLSYFKMALEDRDIPLPRLRPGRYEEQIDELEGRLAGREIVVRFPRRFALRFEFRRGYHWLALSAPGRERVVLGDNDNGSSYPAAFRWEEFLAVVEWKRAHPDGGSIDADRLTLLLLMYMLPATRLEAARARALMRERLVAGGFLRPGEATEFARASFPPQRFVPWVERDGVWVAAQDCCSRRNEEGEPFDHAALSRFLSAIS